MSSFAEGHIHDLVVHGGGPTENLAPGRRGRATSPGARARLAGVLLTTVALLVGLNFAPQATASAPVAAADTSMSASASGDLDWVQRAGGAGADWAEGVAVDGSGAATVTGRFQGSSTFGTGDDAVTVTSAGRDDVFLARYLPDGGLDWVQRAGGTGVDWGHAVAVDGSGVVTVTGRFEGSATFGTGGDAVTVTSNGSGEAFIARYRPDGTLDRVQKAGGTGSDVGLGVAVEESGAVTVTGVFFSSATFGTGGDAVTVTSAGGIDVFVARYRPDGTLDWVQQAGGTGVDNGSAVAVDGSGAASVTGKFQGSATFGSGEDAVTITAVGGDDVFIARYRPDGTLDWVQQAGGTAGDAGLGVAVDGSGAATATGTIAGSVTFGTGDDAVTLPSSGGSFDVFLARYRPDGTLDWVQRAGGTGFDVGRGVAVEESGAAIVTGTIAGSVTFDSGDDAVTVTSAGLVDVFLAHYRPDGTLDRVQRAGGTGSDVGLAVAVEESGAAFVAGFFTGPATFGTGDDTETVTSVGGPDVFLARYGVSTDSVPPTLTVPGDMSVDASGVDGATVEFTASALDDVDGIVEPVCDPPAGSTFPIGTTTVTCTATDTAGNTGQESFDVTVRPVAGAAGVRTLTEGVEDLGLPRGVEGSLLGPLNQAEELLSDGNPHNDRAVCNKLAAFSDAVANRVADGGLSAEQAALLTTYADALAVALGCRT